MWNIKNLLNIKEKTQKKVVPTTMQATRWNVDLKNVLLHFHFTQDWHLLWTQSWQSALFKLKWCLSVYCHILLSNQELAIQFRQPAGFPVVSDFKASVMTLMGQVKQASLFFYYSAYAAWKPLKSCIASPSNPRNKVWIWQMISNLSAFAPGLSTKNRSYP